jgi:hypothetical protein
MKFREMSAIVEAFLWTGGQNPTKDPDWFCDEIKRGNVFFRKEDPWIVRILTPEGDDG